MPTRVTESRGHHYLQEVKSVWDPKKRRSRPIVLAHLGPCDEHGNLLGPPKTRIEGVHSAFPVGPLAILYAASRELQVRERVTKVLGKDLEARLFVALSLNQATDRLPLYRVPSWVQASPLLRWESLEADQVDRSALYRALNSVCHFTVGQGWEDRGLPLQSELTQAWRQGSREPAGVYYDITKQPCYGDANPFVQVGHDSNGGISPVVGFGMVVSREHHHPILCRPLPGAQSDARSVPELLEFLQGEKLRGLTMIMDRGMTSKDNVERIVGAGYHVLGMVRGWNAATQKLASHWSGDELERSEHVVGTSHDSSVYARAITAPLLGRRKMRVAVVENLWKKAAEREGRELALGELEGGPVPSSRMKELRKELKGLLVTSRGRRGVAVNWAAVARDRKLDGRFLLYGTDLTRNGPQMYRDYFRRDAVEKVFRVGKGELSLGPVRFWGKNRTEAYASLFYTAYLLWSWAERRLQEKFPRMTLVEAFRSLERVTWVRFGSGKLVRDWTSRLTGEQEEILKACRAIQYLPGY